MSKLDALKDFDGFLIDALNKKLKQEHNFERVMSKVRQARIAKDLGEDRNSINGLGRVRMEIDTAIYHTWGQKYGYGIWKDKDFLHIMERDNPELRVKCGGTKTQVGWMTSTPLFKKTYAHGEN